MAPLKSVSTYIVIDYTDTGVSVVNDSADTRFSQISSQKRKISQNLLYLFIWGTGRIFSSK